MTWALGHLVTLADPEAYDKKYKSWNMDDLPIMPKKVSLVVIGKTAKQYNAVKTQMLRQDVKDIVIATDAGREGELVARWIIDKAHVKKPLKRLDVYKRQVPIFLSTITFTLIVNPLQVLLNDLHTHFPETPSYQKNS